MRWRLSQHSAARRNLNCSDAPAVQHDEPATVFAAQHARILGKRRDDVFDELVFIGRVGLVVRNIHAIAADEPDTQHRSRHVVQASPAARLAA